MFFKKPETKCTHPCIYIAVGMLMAFGAIACTKPGKKFIKSKMQCMEKKLENCDAICS